MSGQRLSRAENTSQRLEAYIVRTQSALDLFALCTLWIVVVPVSLFGDGSVATTGGLLVRGLVSLVFGIDMFVRSRLAPQSWSYARTHPLGLLAVIFPPVRVVFSLRLVTSLFRQGHIERFLAAATLLLFNGVLIIYFYERDAPGASITSVGAAMWWGVVTVTTVGYGDTYPVTVQGRVVATGIMAIGLLTIAVVTAQVSSGYVDQLNRRREQGLSTPRPPPDVPLEPRHLDLLHERLDRIEARLKEQADAERPPEPDDTV